MGHARRRSFLAEGSHAEGREVRDTPRRRGHRAVGELQLQSLVPLQLRDPVHPHRRARQLPDQRQALRYRGRRGRLGQGAKQQPGLERHRQRHLHAERSSDAGRQRHLGARTDQHDGQQARRRRPCSHDQADFRAHSPSQLRLGARGRSGGGQRGRPLAGLRRGRQLRLHGQGIGRRPWRVVRGPRRHADRYRGLALRGHRHGQVPDHPAPVRASGIPARRVDEGERLPGR